MMNHRLRNNLFGTPPAPVEEENTKVESRAITDYIREFDFEVHLDDFENSETSTSAIFVRGDRNTSILNARIFKGNALVNLTDVDVTVNIKETKGKSTIPAEVIDVDGLVQINLPTSTVDETGVNLFELVLRSGDRVIISPTYTYRVINSLGEGSLGTTTELTMLQSLMNRIEGFGDIVDNTIDDAKGKLDDTIGEFNETIDSCIDEASEDISNSISEMNIFLDGSINNMQSSVNGAIEECRDALDTAIQECRDTTYESRELISNIVEEFEITQSDIDDVMAMIGGL